MIKSAFIQHIRLRHVQVACPCGIFCAAGFAASAATLVVDGTDAVYGAGLGGNGVSTAPTTFDFAAAAGNVFTFTSVSGLTNCCGNSTPDTNADGIGGPYTATNVSAHNGLSGISAPGTMFLAGVFIDTGNAGSVPASPDYNTGPSVSDASFTPLLNQVFFIGDGLTGNGIGALQSFLAPGSANRLLLGFVDSSGFGGAPSYYGDNTGSLRVTVNLSAVPLPAGLGLLAGALGLLALSTRRRRTVTA